MLSSDIMIKIIIGFMLFFCAVQDLRHKTVSLWKVVLAVLFLFVLAIFDTDISPLNRLGGVFVGGVVLMLSKVTGGKIGMGDGWILCATGLGLGLWRNVELFSLALLLAAVVSIILLAARIVDRKKSIPFVPFLLFGYLGILYF